MGSPDKYLLYILLFLLCGACGTSKKTTSENKEKHIQIPSNEKVYSVDEVDVKPKLNWKKSMHLMSGHYPDDARKKHIKGRVILQCVITKEGSPVECKVYRKLYPSLDKEAIKMAEQLKYAPGLIDGNPVYVRDLVPIVFNMGK